MEDKTFYVHPDNWLAFEAFCVAQTQWVLDSKDRKFALDYLRAEVCWNKLGLDIKRDDFLKIQHLETCVRESV